MIALIVIIGVSLSAALVFGGVLSKAFPSARSERKGPVSHEPASRGGLLARMRGEGPSASKKGAGASSGQNQSMLSHIADAVSRFVPMAEGAGEEDRNWLVYSGVKMTASSFWAFRVISLTGGVVAGLFAAASLADPLRSVSVFILCVILGSQIPMFYIAARRAEWRRQLDEDLPDALDLMAVAVSAGSTFESALRIVAERMDGKLAESFEDVVEESRYSSRNRALANFAARSGVESLQIFAASLAQAEASGAPLLDILQEQASSARTMRRLHIEEKANALQVKMLMPMLMFVFPVLVIILCAPLIGQVLTMLG